MLSPPLEIGLLCSLPVGVVSWRSPEPTRTIIVKATFSIAEDGVAKLDDEQEPLSLDVQNPLGDGADLIAAGDFAPLKARADVLLTGSVHAATPVYVLSAGFAVDKLRKRFYGVASEPATELPLLPSALRASPSADGASVRVGPQPAEASIDTPLPEGFDYGKFNVAPDDQQVAVLSATSRIVLEGLIHGGDRRTVTLSGEKPRVFATIGRRPLDGRALEVSLRADTLAIDADREKCTITWRGIIPPFDGEQPCLVVAFASAKEQMPWSEVQRRLDQAVWTEAIAPEDLLFDEEATVDREPPDVRAMPLGLGGMTLQAAPPAPAPPAPPAPAPALEPEGLTAEEEEAKTAESTSVTSGEGLTFKPSAAKAPGLPFRRGGLVLGQSAALASFGRQPAASATEATPFRAVGSVPPTGSDMIQGPTDPDPTPTDDPRESTSDQVTPFRASAAALPFQAAAPLTPFEAPPARHAAPIATTIGQRVSDEESAKVAAKKAPEPPREAPADPLSVEKYAAIKAAVWGGDGLVEALAKAGLSEGEWSEHERRLAEAITKEGSEGETALAEQIAAALKAAREALPRGEEKPLRALEEEYAALSAALESATDPTATLALRGVSPGQWQRMQSRFQERALVDARLRDAMPAKLSAARKAEDETKPPQTKKRRGKPVRAPAASKRVAAKKT